MPFPRRHMALAGLGSREAQAHGQMARRPRRAGQLGPAGSVGVGVAVDPASEQRTAHWRSREGRIPSKSENSELGRRGTGSCRPLDAGAPGLARASDTQPPRAHRPAPVDPPAGHRCASESRQVPVTWPRPAGLPTRAQATLPTCRAAELHKRCYFKPRRFVSQATEANRNARLLCWSPPERRLHAAAPPTPHARPEHPRAVGCQMQEQRAWVWLHMTRTGIESRLSSSPHFRARFSAPRRCQPDVRGRQGPMVRETPGQWAGGGVTDSPAPPVCPPVSSLFQTGSVSLASGTPSRPRDQQPARRLPHPRF